ncbi:hypothetical protein [Singulisphaera sp. PoT]|uniref:hypothetical protein n=1 Tax=Singulisphaera sp. PoT TaxID=3411797 RepID=UPI003BF46399
MTRPNDDEPTTSPVPEGLTSLIVVPDRDDAIRDLGLLGARMTLAPRAFRPDRLAAELRRDADLARRAYRSGFASLN